MIKDIFIVSYSDYRFHVFGSDSLYKISISYICHFAQDIGPWSICLQHIIAAAAAINHSAFHSDNNLDFTKAKRKIRFQFFKSKNNPCNIFTLKDYITVLKDKRVFSRT